ncbi:hypothetical protein OESDEN_14570 [Oesophagostomum dentatum]|uniref:Uncharacterized protein n=1 Tax=Oesophagostomum dentatum TaxID=61180 RepID=A0A0B1SQC2_OESDE|nr:hypothetical protein OESDEN_14570 [Oesophagostomum dentatum]
MFQVKYANDFSIKSNRAGTKLLSLIMASFYSYGNLHAPMVMLLSVFGMFSAIVSKTVRVEMIFSAVIDYLGFAPTWEAKTFTMLFICLMVTFFNFLSYCPDCYTVELSMETIVLPNVSLVIILGELIVVCGLYGVKRFFNNVSTMIVGKAVNLRTKASVLERFTSLAGLVLWRVVIPTAIVYSLIAYLLAARTNVEYYDVAAHALLLLPIPLCALYKVFYFYIHRRSLWRLFIPDAELWGPRSSTDRELAEKNEKLVRF